MSTIDDVFSYLQQQGLMPSMEEFGITFKYQMASFVVFKDDDDQAFLQIAMPGIFEADENNMMEVLIACNKNNNEKKVVKTVMNDNSVWVLYEIILDTTPQYDDVIPRGLNMILSSRESFYQALKEA